MAVCWKRTIIYRLYLCRPSWFLDRKKSAFSGHSKTSMAKKSKNNCLEISKFGSAKCTERIYKYCHTFHFHLSNNIAANRNQLDRRTVKTCLSNLICQYVLMQIRLQPSGNDARCRGTRERKQPSVSQLLPFQEAGKETRLRFVLFCFSRSNQKKPYTPRRLSAVGSKWTRERRLFPFMTSNLHKDQKGKLCQNLFYGEK